MSIENKEIYASMFAEMGIQKGDTLFVSSDLRRLFFVHARKYKETLCPDDIIDVLQELVGETGTLIFPTYNWDFCKGITFDYFKTPGLTGALGVAALKRNEFRRTHHPMYSCAVWGKYQEELYNLQYKSSFGADSIFGWLDRMHVKDLVIDVSVERWFGYTFVHYVEQNSHHVPYRFEKDFTAGYIDEFGNETQRTYSMFVRYLDMDVIADFHGLDEILYNMGISKRYNYDGIDYKIIDMHASVEPIMDDIINNYSRNIARYKGQPV